MEVRQHAHEGWYKCNTEGVSRGNPGPSSLGFYLRDSQENLIYAKSKKLKDATNVVAEARAILEGLTY